MTLKELIAKLEQAKPEREWTMPPNGGFIVCDCDGERHATYTDADAKAIAIRHNTAKLVIGFLKTARESVR